MFLIPLLLGFAANLASAFTTAFTHRWGERRGTLISAILRNVLGIPVWAGGFALAAYTKSPDLIESKTAILAAGWLLIAVGAAIITIALVTIRRRAAAPSTRDALAQTGIYAIVRHPIHTGTFLELVGLFLVIPTQAVAMACILGVSWVWLQTGLEEIDLCQRLPAYREYMNRVPRFLPRLWPIEKSP